MYSHRDADQHYLAPTEELPSGRIHRVTIRLKYRAVHQRGVRSARAECLDEIGGDQLRFLVRDEVDLRSAPRSSKTDHAELIAATGGLGYLIMQAGDYLNTALSASGTSPQDESRD
jgi:hypothetical protein